jgi:hypothetical protein
LLVTLVEQINLDLFLGVAFTPSCCKNKTMLTL